MENYFSLQGECVTQKIIEKSKFIATSRHIGGEEEARAFLDEMRAKYADATHNCYAFVADKLGNFLRFSDDGEPQGTAGMPMLEVLRHAKLFEVAVVVMRYFGGIKLGAGGLVRAYSGAVAENIAAAQKVEYCKCAESKYFLDYPLIDAAQRYISESGASLENCDYSDGVCFTIAVKKDSEADFNAGLLNRLNGRVKIEKSREYFFPFKV